MGDFNESIDKSPKKVTNTKCPHINLIKIFELIDIHKVFAGIP